MWVLLWEHTASLKEIRMLLVVADVMVYIKEKKGNVLVEEISIIHQFFADNTINCEHCICILTAFSVQGGKGIWNLIIRGMKYIW